MAAHFGLAGLPDSGFKFEYILLYLRDVAAAAQLGEFNAELLSALRMVYGSKLPMEVAATIGFYADCVQSAAKGEAVNPVVAEEVRSKLKEEIESFETLKQLYFSTHIDVPPSLLDSRLLLSNKDSKKLNRYEITLARQFHDALDQFMEYRRFRLTLGGTGEQGLVNVEAASRGEAGQAPCSTARSQTSPAECDDGPGGAAEPEATRPPLGATNRVVLQFEPVM